MNLVENNQSMPLAMHFSGKQNVQNKIIKLNSITFLLESVSSLNYNHFGLGLIRLRPTINKTVKNIQLYLIERMSGV